jgi:hypothetical protein
MKLTWENRSTRGEKPVPVPLCPPQIPHPDRTRASAVRGRRLTAWAMARPQPRIVTRVLFPRFEHYWLYSHSVTDVCAACCLLLLSCAGIAQASCLALRVYGLLQNKLALKGERDVHVNRARTSHYTFLQYITWKTLKYISVVTCLRTAGDPSVPASYS